MTIYQSSVNRERVHCHRLNFVLMRHCKRQLDASHMSEKDIYSSQQCFCLFVPSIQPLNFERWEEAFFYSLPALRWLSPEQIELFVRDEIDH